MRFTAHDWVAYHADHRPNSPALRCVEDGRVLSWAELDDRVGRLAALLSVLGVTKGDRVALIAENDPRVFEAQFAAMRIGALFVPLNWRLTTHELSEICLDCTPKVMLHDGGWAKTATDVADKASIPVRLAWGSTEGGDWDGLDTAGYLAPTSDPKLDDPIHILYTSGTTGRPKGALGTHGTLLWNSINTAHSTGYAKAGCNHLNQMPLFHAGGLNVMSNPILYFGGMVTTMTRFVPDQMVAAMADPTYPVTHLAAIPAMYQAIADQPNFATADLSALRHLICAGAIATPELLQLWADRGVPLHPQYGGTEMGPMATALDDEAASLGKAKLGSAGRKAFHTDLRLVNADEEDVPDGENGEIWLRGPAITVGYWGKSREDYFTGEWFRTGDVARRDADGFYYLAGRTKEMYKSGGENVYPAEIENLLSLHPAIADVAVVGVPDARWGEVGTAVVVPAPGTEITLDELHAYVGDRLARYKLPKHLVLVDELARNVTGKVNRPELVRLYSPDPAVPAAGQ